MAPAKAKANRRALVGEPAVVHGGEESGVSKAIQQVKQSRDGKLNRLKQRLQDLNNDREKSKQAD
jgi:hypothetical protein